MPEITVGKALTVPVLRLDPGVENFIHILEKIRDGREVLTESGSPRMNPARVLRVIDLSDCVTKDIVCPVVLAGILETDVVDYVGKDLRIVKHPPEPPKKYSKFTVEEISLKYDTKAGEVDPRPKQG